MFCNDKSLASKSIGDGNTAKGYGINKTYYSAVERFTNSEGLNIITTAAPKLKCAENSEYNYSRYTSKLDTNELTTKGVSINNDLLHPIALISLDELVMAGLFINSSNSNSYIFDAYKNGTSSIGFWTMTPYYSFTNGSTTMYVISYNQSSYNTSTQTQKRSIRPVINLRKDVLISGGNGTKTTPYTINYN